MNTLPGAQSSLPALSNLEMDKARLAFDRFDEDASGSIDMWELRKALQSMGQSPSQDELLELISHVDKSM